MSSDDFTILANMSLDGSFVGEFTVPFDASVSDVRAHVADKLGIKPPCVQLIAGESVLNDLKLVADVATSSPFEIRVATRKLDLSLQGGHLEIPVPKLDFSLVGNSFTLECWTKLNPGKKRHGSLFGAGKFIGHQESKNKCLHVSPFNFNFYLNDMTFEDKVEDQALLDLVDWVHCAFTYDRALGCRSVFLNGERVAMQDSGVEPLQAADPLYVGTQGWSWGGYWPGCVKDVRIWNHARSPEQVVDCMLGTVDTPDEGLVAWWPLDGDLTDEGWACEVTARGAHAKIAGEHKWL